MLCGPQGPQNVGSVARVMQNFGIYDLRITDPGPFVLAGGGTRDVARPPPTARAAPAGSTAAPPSDPTASVPISRALRPTRVDRPGVRSPADHPELPARNALCDEAYRFACAADWLLADAERCDTALEAISDCTFVMATTARPRGNVPLVTARVAAESWRRRRRGARWRCSSATSARD